MASSEKFADLSLASDAQVLDQLSSLVRSGRRVTAEIVAHLAEIDERRLHLKAGYNSLFAYCVSVHGMSEDEACRRIEVARLGRKFPGILPMLADGELSLSVAALLKTHLTEGNEQQLLAAVSGKSVSSAREALAARFPMPDAPASVRKLPVRLAPTQPQATSEPNARQSGSASVVIRDIADRDEANVSVLTSEPVDGVTRRSQAVGELVAQPVSECASLSGTDGGPQMLARAQPTPAAIRPSDRGRIEPISLGRYRVQFTAGAPLKEKLELLRDLMAHRNPTRDFAPIVERALDLLLEKLLRERTGKAVRPRPETAPGNTPRWITRATRAVSQRDGLRCSFVGPQGQRRDGRAFLEYDHVRPFAKGGGSGPDNLRLVCRAHKRFFAEMEYGSAKIRSEIAKRRDQVKETER